MRCLMPKLRRYSAPASSVSAACGFPESDAPLHWDCMGLALIALKTDAIRGAAVLRI
jgi:hypothetical protein